MHGGPVAVPDVSAYLSVAQWPFDGLLPPDLAFHPGYGIVLAPLGWLEGDGLHTAALVLNGVLAGVCVVLAGSLARSLSTAPWVATWACIAAALHPSISVASRIGWPETLLVVVVLVTGLLLTKGRLTWFGAISGLAIAVHPRMIAVAIAALVVAAATKKISPVLKGLTLGVLCSAAMLQITNSWPSARIDAATANSEMAPPFGAMAGQLLALSGGTAGLAVLGLVASLALIRDPVPNAAGLFLGISAIGMLLLGGWVLAGSDRVDTLLYSRYIGPWAIPLVIVALAAASQRVINLRCVCIALSLISVALICVLSGAHSVAGSPRTIMTLDLVVLWSLADGQLVATAVLAALIGALSLITTRNKPAVAAALLVVLAIPSLVISHQKLHDVGLIAAGQATTSLLVPDEIGCLAHDTSTKSYAMWLYRLNLPHLFHQRVDLIAGGTPCGPYVIATVDKNVVCEHAELVGEEPRGTWGLWRYPADSCS